MFYKKKRIEPKPDSLIWFTKHKHRAEHNWQTSWTFYNKLKEWKIKEVFYPIYKWDTMIWRRRLFVDLS